MDKKRYWKKQVYLANYISHITSSIRVRERAYNLAMEIDDYLYNLEE